MRKKLILSLIVEKLKALSNKFLHNLNKTNVPCNRIYHLMSNQSYQRQKIIYYKVNNFVLPIIIQSKYLLHIFPLIYTCVLGKKVFILQVPIHLLY